MFKDATEGVEEDWNKVSGRVRVRVRVRSRRTATKYVRRTSGYEED